MLPGYYLTTEEALVAWPDCGDLIARGCCYGDDDGGCQRAAEYIVPTDRRMRRVPPQEARLLNPACEGHVRRVAGPLAPRPMPLELL